MEDCLFWKDILPKVISIQKLLNILTKKDGCDYSVKFRFELELTFHKMFKWKFMIISKMSEICKCNWIKT